MHGTLTQTTRAMFDQVDAAMAELRLRLRRLRDERIKLEQALDPTHATIAHIQTVVARHFGTTRWLILSENRVKPVMTARLVGYWLAHQMGRRPSLNAIGRAFGDRDHSTIDSGIKNVRARLLSDPGFAVMVDAIKAEILAELAQAHIRASWSRQARETVDTSPAAVPNHEALTQP